jgi:hypothetical protein
LIFYGLFRRVRLPEENLSTVERDALAHAELMT